MAENNECGIGGNGASVVSTGIGASVGIKASGGIGASGDIGAIGASCGNNTGVDWNGRNSGRPVEAAEAGKRCGC